MEETRENRPIHRKRPNPDEMTEEELRWAGRQIKELVRLIKKMEANPK